MFVKYGKIVGSIFCLFLWLALCDNVRGEEGPKVGEETEKVSPAGPALFRGWGFTVNVDLKEKVCSESPADDFVLYQFSCRDKVFLDAYAGNAPQFPLHAPKNAKERKRQLNGLKTECFEWQNQKQEYSKECLVHLTGYSFPQYIHFSYFDLKSEEKERADSIILSTKEMKDCADCEKIPPGALSK